MIGSFCSSFWVLDWGIAWFWMLHVQFLLPGPFSFVFMYLAFGHPWIFVVHCPFRLSVFNVLYLWSLLNFVCVWLICVVYCLFLLSVFNSCIFVVTPQFHLWVAHSVLFIVSFGYHCSTCVFVWSLLIFYLCVAHFWLGADYQVVVLVEYFGPSRPRRLFWNYWFVWSFSFTFWFVFECQVFPGISCWPFVAFLCNAFVSFLGSRHQCVSFNFATFLLVCMFALCGTHGSRASEVCFGTLWFCMADQYPTLRSFFIHLPLVA